ncbi:outer membrane lipoprotein-sorting protein [Pedobacter mucosus]|uniref:outer membrane lipoprotein-sorting protein n=1 Tax=Pedobacter mucosus TaxID=2895286 RepID=UPI001EE46D50|nr:outer membrane lipoprotein-sorting protein [Pedobacter mucosus]UKT64675.1 outer membrane lipoprotein-sorting protein [Pedobacter mucosus]
MKKSLLYFLLTFVSNVVFSQSTVKQALSVQQIFEQSEKSYAAIKTYLDSGKVITEYYNKELPSKSSIKFKTAYSKLNGFNFEYYVPNQSASLYIINKTGNVVKSWWGIRNKIESPASLSAAISAATGISSSTSNIIPGLLFPEEWKQKNIYKNIKAVISGSENINGHGCYVIEGKRFENEVIKLWISKTDFMIRKIYTDSKLDVKATRAKSDSLLNNSLNSLSKRIDLEKDSIKKASLVSQVNAIKKARSNVSRFNAGLIPPILNYRKTYHYYPYALKTVKSDFFTFHPNREVAL